MADPYLPYTVTIRKITVENDARDIKTFELVFADQSQRDSFDFVPGQFAELSVFGAGEAPIGIASSPLDADCITFSIVSCTSKDACVLVYVVIRSIITPVPHPSFFEVWW